MLREGAASSTHAMVASGTEPAKRTKAAAGPPPSGGDPLLGGRRRLRLVRRSGNRWRRAENAVIGHKLGGVRKACPSVLGGAPRSPRSAAAALPDLHGGVEPWEVLVKYLAVEVLLFGVRRVLGEGLRGFGPLLVGDGVFAHLLQLRHPRLAYALALHGLCPPEHLVGNLAPEELAQHGLLRPVRGDLLEAGVHAHGSLDDVRAEEGHARLHGMGHGHAVRALAVDVVEVPEDAAQLAEEHLR
mmetsp:Transcript_3626/g.9620  ORF Transcript_3626/g.9620 Transcript_3626/m.9620 type:complete len:243 (+) Transcript_3626:109-837(+)